MTGEASHGREPGPVLHRDQAAAEYAAEIHRVLGGDMPAFDLIQLGMGIGFLPKPIVDSSNFASVLWPLLSDAEAPVCSVYLMANAGSVRSAPAQLLLDKALTHLQQ